MARDTCIIPGCETHPDEFSDQPKRCRFHHVSWGGVYDGECDCWQSPADNADVYVCGPHRRAYEREKARG